MRNITGVATTDVITTNSRHGYVAGNRVVMRPLTGGAGLTAGTVYYVVAPVTDTTFKVSATKGGAAIDFTTDITAGRVRRRITVGNGPKGTAAR